MSGKIDLDKLRAAIAGDPSRKVAVRKDWLAAVLEELETLDRIRASRKAGDGVSKIFEHLWAGRQR